MRWSWVRERGRNRREGTYRDRVSMNGSEEFRRDWKNISLVPCTGPR